jgi:hypothetical protein
MMRQKVEGRASRPFFPGLRSTVTGRGRPALHQEAYRPCFVSGDRFSDPASPEGDRFFSRLRKKSSASVMQVTGSGDESGRASRGNC